LSSSVEAALERALREEGLAGAARHLNGKVKHRYTAIFLREGASLRNVALFDKNDPSPGLWPPFPIGNSFCSIVIGSAKPLEVREARSDPRAEVRNHPAAASWQSYAGVPLIDAEGDVFGALCHFDALRCEAALDLEEMLQVPVLLRPYLQ
jgi:hypothetical protein